MTPTSDERRDVAARLRNFEQLRDVLGVGYMDWEHICARLADLIDRPTCNDVGDRWTFRCSVCGCELDTEDREGEPTMWDGGSATTPRYCPSCGALVWRLTRDDD